MKDHVIQTITAVICLVCIVLAFGGCTAYESSLETSAPATATSRPSITPRPSATARPSAPKPTATPKPSVRPSATPKPTVRPSAKPSADPFDAGDYSHPDDFYYDHYDDFFDYEDAEDYWEDYN